MSYSSELLNLRRSSEHQNFSHLVRDLGGLGPSTLGASVWRESMLEGDCVFNLINWIQFQIVSELHADY